MITIIFIMLILSCQSVNRSQVLLMMMKIGVQPSHSLCQDLSMVKCDQLCCDVFFYIKLRKSLNLNKLEKQDDQQHPPSYQQLCKLNNHSYCDKKCCTTGSCKVKEIGNLQIQPGCAAEQPSHEQICKGIGLLWCDGQCCGFTASKHKCFKMIHFGLPYIRCPIEATQKMKHQFNFIS